MKLVYELSRTQFSWDEKAVEHLKKAVLLVKNSHVQEPLLNADRREKCHNHESTLERDGQVLRMMAQVMTQLCFTGATLSRIV